ncbi:MAG TPA: cell division protein FtsL [Candidatus Tetragenococcus pullicola]|nr:cell division protein FtsL [Candidatus Tetragenococcus pullicola]
MTAVKVQEFTYDEEVKESVDFENDLNESLETPKRPEVIAVPYSPSRKLEKISKMEKVIVAFIVLFTIGLSILTIKIRTSISQVEQDITTIQKEVEVDEQESQQLEQEKSELSKSDRIQKIAEKKGLSIDSDHLRKVKK